MLEALRDASCCPLLLMFDLVRFVLAMLWYRQRVQMCEALHGASCFPVRHLLDYVHARRFSDNLHVFA